MSRKKKRGWRLLPVLMTCVLSLTGCAATPKPKIEKINRPVFPVLSEQFYRLAPLQDQKAILKHEWDWQAYADRMEARLEQCWKK